MRKKHMLCIILLILLSVCLSAQIFAAPTLVREFPNHAIVNDGMTKYKIGTCERYSQWASGLEQKYGIAFEEWKPTAQKVGVDNAVEIVPAPTRPLLRWELSCILYQMNAEKYDAFPAERQPKIDEVYQIVGYNETALRLSENMLENLYRLYYAKVLNGYEDGSFGIFSPVTRAEFVKMLENFGYLKDAGNAISFDDTQGHWAQSVIAKAATKGYVSGVDKTHFAPDNQITTEQVLAILDRMEPDAIDKIRNSLMSVFGETYRFYYHPSYLNDPQIVATIYNITEEELTYGRPIEPLWLSVCRRYTEEELAYIRDFDTLHRPELADCWTYISNTVPKEVYDFGFYFETGEGILPTEFMVEYAPYYTKSFLPGVKRAEEYLNYILNLDYQTITYEELQDKTVELTTFRGGLEDYVNYAKSNQIKLSGKAEAIMPSIYRDHGEFKVRMKLDFRILSSLTDENLLPCDLKAFPCKYEKSEYSFYVDVPLGWLADDGSYGAVYKGHGLMRLPHYGEQ